MGGIGCDQLWYSPQCPGPLPSAGRREHWESDAPHTGWPQRSPAMLSVHSIIVVHATGWPECTMMPVCIVEKKSG